MSTESETTEGEDGGVVRDRGYYDSWPERFQPVRITGGAACKVPSPHRQRSTIYKQVPLQDHLTMLKIAGHTCSCHSHHLVYIDQSLCPPVHSDKIKTYLHYFNRPLTDSTLITSAESLRCISKNGNNCPVWKQIRWRCGSLFKTGDIITS
jgi:hypothetical protein